MQDKSRWSSWSQDVPVNVSTVTRAGSHELRRVHARLDGTYSSDVFEFQQSSTDSGDVEEYPPSSSVTNRSTSMVEFRDNGGTESSDSDFASTAPRFWLPGRRRERSVMRNPNCLVGSENQPPPMISLREALQSSIVPHFLRMPLPNECEAEPMSFHLHLTLTRYYHHMFPSTIKNLMPSAPTFLAMANSDEERVEVKVFHEKGQNQYHFAITSIPRQPYRKGTKLIVQGTLFGTFTVQGIAKFLGEWSYLECIDKELGMNVILRAMDYHVIAEGPPKLMVIQGALRKFKALNDLLRCK
ncbi:hypothetical protein B0H13DRAFT_2352126 [Mycena leptocephala]|nr:hypothetical protein B0H13DRAFT_2352126 [Mycena leptocephala]